MEESLSRSPSALEARRALHEAIGRFPLLVVIGNVPDYKQVQGDLTPQQVKALNRLVREEFT